MQVPSAVVFDGCFMSLRACMKIYNKLLPNENEQCLFPVSLRQVDVLKGFFTCIWVYQLYYHTILKIYDNSVLSTKPII